MKIYQDPDPAGFRQAEFRISGFSKNQIPDNRISVKIRPDPDIRYSPNNWFNLISWISESIRSTSGLLITLKAPESADSTRTSRKLE